MRSIGHTGPVGEDNSYSRQGLLKRPSRMEVTESCVTPLAHGYWRSQGGCYRTVIISFESFQASESGGMVDTLDLGSSAFGRAGSSPASRTALEVGSAQAAEKNWGV